MAAESPKKTFQEYGRGIIGGLLFSLPLLYTMEVWWTGFSIPSLYLLVGLLATFILLIGYNTYAGMKKDTKFIDIIWDSVEEIGLALIVSFLFLLLINRIGLTMSFTEIAGKVIVEAMIVAIGLSVGTAQLGNQNNKESGMEDGDEINNPFLKFTILSVCGAVLFASSVAPTEEILMIALQSGMLHLLIMVIFSLAIIAVTLYFSNFQGTGSENPKGRFMLFEIIVSYLAALLVSFGFLYFFGRVAGHGLLIVVAQVIVLAIPASIGAAVGRLLIDGNEK